MQAFDDIFSIWDDISDMATALNEKQDTVYRWSLRGRIPDNAWDRVIEAAKKRGTVLTVADLHAANKPRKSPSHKLRPSRKRRSEPRAVL